MYLLTVPSFNHLHFHRHVLFRNNTFSGHPSYRVLYSDTHRIGIQTNILELTSWAKWRLEYADRLLSTIQNGGTRWWIFCFSGEEFHWDRMHYGSTNNGQYTVSGVTFSFNTFVSLDSCFFILSWSVKSAFALRCFPYMPALVVNSIDRTNIRFCSVL